MTDLFKTETVENPPENDDPLLPKIEELKTKSVEELAKGKAHADQFIEFLKEQNKGLTEELAKRSSAEKVLEDLKAARQTDKETRAPEGAGINPEDVKNLAREVLIQENQKKQVESNMAVVDKAVREKYGEKAGEFVAKKAQELGVSLDELAGIAAKSPVAFFSMIGIDKTTNSFESSKSTINTEMLGKQSGASIGTAKYYSELRKANPAQFYSPAVQRQMFADRKTKGEDFYK